MTTQQEILEEFKKLWNKDSIQNPKGFICYGDGVPRSEESIKQFLISSLSKYRQSVLGEVEKALKEFGVILEQRDELEGREAIYEFIQKLKSLNK